MIKQAMSDAGLEVLAVGGLLTFVAVFVGVTVWVMTRGNKEIDTWSSLPLADGYDPVEPRLPITGKPSDSDDQHDKDHHGEGGCGKCENCTCHDDSPVTVTTLSAN